MMLTMKMLMMMTVSDVGGDGDDYRTDDDCGAGGNNDTVFRAYPHAHNRDTRDTRARHWAPPGSQHVHFLFVSFFVFSFCVQSVNGVERVLIPYTSRHVRASHAGSI